MISPDHLDKLAASGITEEFAMARGYETITDDKRRLAELKIAKAGRNTPGLLIPLLRADGSTWGYQYRPDAPRCDSYGRGRKYETPWQQPNGLDIPPGVAAQLGDPAVPLFITEGAKKADSAALRGLCVVDLIGVWNWLYTNTAGGKMALPEWRDCALNSGRRVVIGFDSDAARNDKVQKAARALAVYLATKGARIEYLWLPDDTGRKIGLDDYLAEHTVDELWRLVKPVQPPTKTQTVDDTDTNRQADAPKAEPVQPISLDNAHAVFKKWLGKDYDTDALDACLAAAAVEQLDGDPLWLLIVSGSSAAKTETVHPFRSVGGLVVGNISSEAALLSASPKHEHAKDATGGLLRQLGSTGLLVVKDVSSILSMDHVTRGRVLSALREIYDGYWVRNVGAEGGRTIPWAGRIAVIGAVTTAWDTHHSVIAAMGDRFLLLRMDSTDEPSRTAAGLRAIGNTGDEATMRDQLAGAVAGVIAGMNRQPIRLTDTETSVIVAAADLVTRARTAVEYSMGGDIIDAHALEMPARCAKQLAQVVRGAVAIGIDRTAALRLAIRCARDSLPPLRLAIIDDVAANPHSSTAQVRKRIDKPYTTVDRQLQSLHALGVLTVTEEPYDENRNRWFYQLAEFINPDALRSESSPEKEEDVVSGQKKGVDGEGETDSAGLVPHFSGELSDPPVSDPSPNGHPHPHASFTPPTGRGRCPECHWHIATQGHAPSCTAVTEPAEVGS